jgi:hypothetical protein
MSLKGLFSSMSMADLIQWARTAQRTGIVVVRRSDGPAIRKIAFDRGRIVACSSNSPREHYGRYLVNLGLASQDEIDRAVAKQRESGIMLAALLVSSGRISEAQAAATLEEKTIDSISDVFLWKDGSFEYDPAPVFMGKSVAISLDPIGLVFEGIRRADEWTQLRTVIAGSSIYEPSGQPLPEGAIVEEPALCERLLPSFDGSTSVADLLEQLPYGCYRIWRAVSDLLVNGALRAGESTGVPDRRRRFDLRMEEARLARAKGGWSEALVVLEGLAKSYPERGELTAEIAETTAGFRRWLFEEHFGLEDIPLPAIGPKAMLRLRLGPTDGFILSRVDGRLRVSDILRISPVREVDALRSLLRLLEAKVVDFPTIR